MKGRGGFTLLELVIVIIIIGILAAIAIPRITTGTAAAASNRAAHTISNYNNFVKASQSAGISEANIIAAVKDGTVLAGVGIQTPLIGTNNDGMWTYTYADPKITATKNADPQKSKTIIYNMNNNQWDGAGDFSPQPASA